jgi:hypothetical protein
MLRSLASVVLRVTESIRSFRKVPVSAGFVTSCAIGLYSAIKKVWPQVEAGPSRGYNGINAKGKRLG